MSTTRLKVANSRHAPILLRSRRKRFVHASDFQSDFRKCASALQPNGEFVLLLRDQNKIWLSRRRHGEYQTGRRSTDHLVSVTPPILSRTSSPAPCSGLKVKCTR